MFSNGYIDIGHMLMIRCPSDKMTRIDLGPIEQNSSLYHWATLCL